MNIAITGVSRGLGKAMALGFAASGHNVIGCARSEDAISQLSAQLVDPHRFEAIDVSDANQVSEMGWPNS